MRLDAQNCIDTVNVKGYYIIQKTGSELTPQINQKGNMLRCRPDY